jgi:AcrR family transcriptional regulator
MTHTPNHTREELLRAALICFSAHGFDGASMRMIAEQANRPISLFPHYFGNKEGLYLEVFKWTIERQFDGTSKTFGAETGTVPRDPTEAVMLLREQMHYFYAKSVNGNPSSDPVFEDASKKLLLLEVNNPRPSLRALFIEYFQDRLETIKKCIKTLRPDLQEDKVIFIGASIVGLVVSHGIMHGLNRILWNTPVIANNQFQDSELLVDMCLYGLIRVGSLTH